MPRKKRHDDVRERVKDAYRLLARLGKLDSLREFKQHCESREGFDPQVARALLIPYAETSTLACQLLAQIKDQSKETHPQLAPKREETEGEGPIVVRVLAPYSPENVRLQDIPKLAKCLRDLGFTVTPPAGWVAPEDWDDPDLNKAKQILFNGAVAQPELNTRGRFALPKKPEDGNGGPESA